MVFLRKPCLGRVVLPLYGRLVSVETGFLSFCSLMAFCASSEAQGKNGNNKTSVPELKNPSLLFSEASRTHSLCFYRCHWKPQPPRNSPCPYQPSLWSTQGLGLVSTFCASKTGRSPRLTHVHPQLLGPFWALLLNSFLASMVLWVFAWSPVQDAFALQCYINFLAPAYGGFLPLSIYSDISSQNHYSTLPTTTGSAIWLAEIQIHILIS